MKQTTSAKSINRSGVGHWNLHRMMKPAALAALAALCFAGCASSTAQKESASACGEESFGCAVDTKAAEADFTEISFDDAISFFEDGNSGLLYFGFPDCPWCKEVVPVLDTLTEEKDVEVFYIRTRDADHNRLYTDEQKEQIMPYLEEAMSENDEGEMTLYVPVVAVVKDGVLEDFHVGSLDGHDASEESLSDQQKEQLEQILSSLVDKADALKQTD